MKIWDNTPFFVNLSGIDPPLPPLLILVLLLKMSSHFSLSARIFFSRYKSSARSSLKMLNCAHCSYSTLSKWNMNRHQKIHENLCDSSASESGFSCQHCLRVFDRAYNCKRHENVCKFRPYANPQKVADSPQKVAGAPQKVALNDDSGNCDDCETESNEIQCGLCYKTFANKWNYKRHADTCEGLTNPLMCPKCRIVCQSKYAKSRHMKTCDGTGNEQAIVVPSSERVCATTTPSIPVIHGGTVNIVVNGNLTYNPVQNTQINNNNKTQVNCFGNEDLSHVMQPEYLDNRLRELDGRGVFQMVKDVHFNKDKPHNRNVMLGSRKRKTLKMREDDGWHVRANDDVLDLLIAKYKKILQTRSHHPEFRNSLRHESDFMQIQQDLIRFDKKSNPTAYYACAHKILALIEDLETDLEKLK